MRIAGIDNFEVNNGEWCGVSLYVQGCPFHCHNCFNPETWDFNGGTEWNEEQFFSFVDIINRPYIKRVSILGGEPLCDANVRDVFELVWYIHDYYPEKQIWLYSGFVFENIIENQNASKEYKYRKDIIDLIDYMVDGRYIDGEKDLTLKFRGSSNQRIIDMKKTIKNNYHAVMMED